MRGGNSYNSNPSAQLPNVCAFIFPEHELIMSATERIRAELDSHPIVVFMKGTPEYPMCGCSERAVLALAACGEPYHAINVLADPELRAQLPRYSNWPTFPQLFIQGELIGGADITVELHEQGELASMLADASGVS